MVWQQVYLGRNALTIQIFAFRRLGGYLNKRCLLEE